MSSTETAPFDRTTPEARAGAGHHGPDREDLERLDALLAPACFPCDRAHLLEAGVQHHAPILLLQALCSLPPGKTWPDVAAVVQELQAAADRGAAETSAEPDPEDPVVGRCGGSAAVPVGGADPQRPVRRRRDGPQPPEPAGEVPLPAAAPRPAQPYRPQ